VKWENIDYDYVGGLDDGNIGMRRVAEEDIWESVTRDYWESTSELCEHFIWVGQ